MRTIKLKIYSPSIRKREIMDEAMLNYSMAFQFLLNSAEGDIGRIEKDYKDKKGKYNELSVFKWISSDLSKELNKFNVEPFKDSLKLDFSAVIAGYLNLKRIKKQANYPVVYITKKEFEEKYINLLDQIKEGKDTDWCENQIEKYMKKSNNYKSVLFSRYDTKRNYCLLYDKTSDRYFAKLYLLNAKSDKRRRPDLKNTRELTIINKNHELMEPNNRKQSFLILPLSFGKWQEGYLKQALVNPEILKGARLVKQGNDYYLSVSVDIKNPEPVKTVTYMGVSRGLKSDICYSVVDEKGCEIVSGKLKNKQIHCIANALVEIAYKNKSQIIMHKHFKRGDKLTWTDGERVITPSFSCSDYNKLYGILKYKLVEYGLPQPVKVSCRGIYNTCPKCGLNSSKNRYSNDIIICISCGFADNIEHTGSLNTAKMLIIYKKSKITLSAKKIDGKINFVNQDLDLEFCPSNPYDCREEFKQELKNISKQLYKGESIKDKKYNKKYSLFKKIESIDDITNHIDIKE